MNLPKREDVPKYLKQLQTSKSADERAKAAIDLNNSSGNFSINHPPGRRLILLQRLTSVIPAVASRRQPNIFLLAQRDLDDALVREGSAGNSALQCDTLF